ncbi:MAG: hypothetical protein KDA47_21580 [Planctomycetales bacterium]|nr:hypothetical protein [Planctomycetales bacterium]
MAIDTPATIAVLGAGPIGLEAALYARFLGYDVLVFDRGDVAENPRHGWGHVRMFTPFHMNRSTLGLAALAAHDRDYRPPDDMSYLTGREWAEHYLAPLAGTDLLSDHLRLHTTVLAVGKETFLKHESPGDEVRGDEGFRILTRTADGQQQIHRADVVIDTTGVFGNPNSLGAGGIPAIGERQLRTQIEFGLPDLLGSARADHAGRRVLLIGAGYSAATNVVALAELAREAPGTEVTWITRREADQPGSGPIQRFENDRLHERDQLARRANKLAASGAEHVAHWPATVVERIERDSPDGPFRVTLAGDHAGEFEFDRVIANVGWRPDVELFRELQVHLCYATEGPMKLAAAMMGQTSADCLNQSACGPQTLLNPEMDFYVLGAKSFGRNSQFLFATGLEQIRELFTIIGDRESLNLYAGMAKLPQ